jgi:levanbiose-producing levanase
MLYLLSATTATSLTGYGREAGTGSPLLNRPRFHLAPTSGWINDPQRPIWIDNKWNLWVLYNADYPTAGGTAWRHYTSHDLMNWTDCGISIPKYTNQYGDVWTGSTVIDVNNTAGYGAGALIALMTMPCDTPSGQQNQSTALWYSKDNGKTFTFGSIVQPNFPGNNAIFRDPSVFWYAPTQRWIMSLAESNKLSIYTSKDLKNWAYASGLIQGDLGIMECPNLFLILLHDENDRPLCEKWVLLCGANGYLTGFTTGTFYWVGSFDGTAFSPDSGSGKWLDGGSDFYACTVFPAPDSSKRLSYIHAIAWMNNWGYATQIPTIGYYGQLSVARTLHLKLVNATPLLMNAPLEGLNWEFTSTVVGADQTINDQTSYSFPDWTNTPACRIDFTLTPENGVWPAAIFFSMRGGNSYFTQLTFDCGKKNIFFKRDTSGPQPTSDSSWTANRNVPYAFPLQPITITVLIDVNSVEVFINHGEISISSLITGPLDATGLNMSLAGGSARVSGLTIRSIS